MSQPIYFAPLRVPLVDMRTGLISREWYLLFQQFFARIGGAKALNNTELEFLARRPIPVFLGDDGGGGDGEMGPPGQRGLDGATGLQGVPGPAVFLEAEQIEPDFVVLPGPAGPAGANGAPGVAGTQGPGIFLVAEDGADGDQGPPGPAGAQGAAGATGATGAQGAAIFLAGEDGADGDAGPPGIQGIQGIQGAPIFMQNDEIEPDVIQIPGPQGPTGATGATGAAAQGITMGQAAADLGFGSEWRRSGTFFIEPAAGFTASQVGKPVIVQQASRSDEDEHTQLLCTGEVINRKRLRVRYLAVGGVVRGSRTFNYVISN